MTTIQDINSTIISGQFTNDQLNSIIAAVTFARNQLAQRTRFTLVKGSQVKFVSSRSGKTVLGTVEKVNRKFVIVKENGMMFQTWRVPANMLEAA
jgi:hypothetical protein